MDILLIRGGKRLTGTISVSGAKNAALPLMTATILSRGKSVLENVPDLRDIRTMSSVLSTLGAEVVFEGNRLTIDTTNLSSALAPYELVKTMRASVLTLGPMIARFGHASVSLPGGCAIGARPINLHLMGLERMGAEISLESGYVVARCKRLNGSYIYFDIVSVTGTENLMMAAVFAKGKTILENAAREPEVQDLADALNRMGARINGAGTSVIEIDGVEELYPMRHTIIPDRIETGTFMAIAGATKGDITITGVRFDHIEAIVEKLRDTGIVIEQDGHDRLKVAGPQRLKAVDMKTTPFPGFPTDMQAQFMALMSIADGTSIVQETIFENRFMHVAELRRMGANIEIVDNSAYVRGVDKLSGAPVMATDLRASASLVVAALAADGESIIDRIYHLDRGYESMEEKVARLGGDISRIKK